MTQTTTPTPTSAEAEIRPWPALFSLVLGFFMILVDLTIVTVATPTIIDKLHASVNETLWVSSAYMLAYAVPVLITGRLGDRYGSKHLYLIGLTVFTLASLWCGLANGIAMLIVARLLRQTGPRPRRGRVPAHHLDRRGTALELGGGGVVGQVGGRRTGHQVDVAHARQSSHGNGPSVRGC